MEAKPCETVKQTVSNSAVLRNHCAAMDSIEWRPGNGSSRKNPQQRFLGAPPAVHLEGKRFFRAKILSIRNSFPILTSERRQAIWFGTVALRKIL